jgi:hypothetical protein
MERNDGMMYLTDGAVNISQRVQVFENWSRFCASLHDVSGGNSDGINAIRTTTLHTIDSMVDVNCHKSWGAQALQCSKTQEVSFSILVKRNKVMSKFDITVRVLRRSKG